MHGSRSASLVSWVTFILRIILGGVFVMSAVGKVLEPREEFLGVVRVFAVLPQPLDLWYAALLPWAELLAGIFVLLGMYRRIAAGVIALMLLSFFIALEHARGSQAILATCGCFGAFSGTETFAQLFFRDAGLFVAAAWTLVAHQDRWSLDRYLKKRS